MHFSGCGRVQQTRDSSGRNLGKCPHDGWFDGAANVRGAFHADVMNGR
jgi:hypothetical protein